MGYLDFLRKRCNVLPKRGPFHFRAPADFRGSSASVRQEEEDGHPVRAEGSPSEARQEVLPARKTRPRGRLEVPGHRRSLGGKEEGEGRSFPQGQARGGKG